VSPRTHGQHRRRLLEPGAGVDALEADIVEVDRDDATEDEPAPKEPLAVGCVEERLAAKRVGHGHPEQRIQLLVDALHGREVGENDPRLHQEFARHLDATRGT
jgi:hypothetical protein